MAAMGGGEAVVKELEEQRTLLGTRCVGLAVRVAVLEARVAELEAENAALKSKAIAEHDEDGAPKSNGVAVFN